MTIRVFLADDHAVMRDGLKALLQAAGDITVVGEVGNGQEAVRRVLDLRPDVVLMDIAMPELNCIEAARLLREKCPGARIVMLSMYSSSEHVYRALDAGAAGYLLKESAASGPARACAATRPGAAAGAHPGGLIQKRHNGSATQAGDPARPTAARTVHIAPKRRHSRAEVGLKQPQSVANSHRTPGD